MKTKASYSTSCKHTIGLDLGDVRHNICVLDRTGKIIDERTITNHRESLRRLGKKYPGARLALEVGSHSPWISRFLKQLGLEVIVANARKLRAIYMNDRKSDELDAQMLAKIARVDPSLLYPIEHGSEQAQRDLLQIKLRDNLVRQRVDIISSVRFTLKSLGVRLPSPNTASFAKRARTLLAGEHAELLAMIEPSLSVVDELTKRIREFDRAIERLCEERYPQTALLRQIFGVGPITALCFVLVVDQQFGRNYPNAGYGGNFFQWMTSNDPAPYNSWGNGSAMRVSPIGWVANDLDWALSEASRSAEVTHNHPEGVKGARAVAGLVFLARTGHSKDDLREFIESQIGYNLSRSLDQIRPGYVFDVSCQGSVPEAITAFLESSNFEDSLRKAISLGGDSDTIACITGAIAHAFYQDIPSSMIDYCTKTLDRALLSINEDFWKRFPDETGSRQR